MKEVVSNLDNNPGSNISYNAIYIYHHLEIRLGLSNDVLCISAPTVTPVCHSNEINLMVHSLWLYFILNTFRIKQWESNLIMKTPFNTFTNTYCAQTSIVLFLPKLNLRLYYNSNVFFY